jgi:NAD(P)H-dependent flavin oxidoreductase YrpB (nitropropane dioxygenase family)
MASSRGPGRHLLDRLKATKARVIGSATTVREAQWLEAHGCDAVIAMGLEAGGHRGNFLSDDMARQVGTFALVPQIADAVKLPVMAAGGIADPRGIVAARVCWAPRRFRSVRHNCFVPRRAYRGNISKRSRTLPTTTR